MRTQFRIPSSEGLPIRGTLEIPEEPSALVVIIHGFKGFQQWGFFPWVAERFAAGGLASCRFDMSRGGIGESGDTFDRLDLFADDTFSIAIEDVLTVVRHVRSIDELAEMPLYLFGHSRGGGVAILSAEEIPDLAGVVTWASISTVMRWDEPTMERWRREGQIVILNQRTGQEMKVSTAVLDDCIANRERLDIDRALQQLPSRLLVVHGTADESVPVAEANRIDAHSRRGSLMIIEGAGHTFGAIHPMVTIPRPLRLAMSVTLRFVSGE